MDAQPAPAKDTQTKPRPVLTPAGPVPATAVAADPEASEITVSISIWQHPFVQNVLPFLTSLALHAGLVIMGIAGYKAATTIVTVVKEQIIIPDAAIVEGADVGAPPQPKLRSDGGSSNNNYDIVTETRTLTEKKTTLNNALMGGGEESSEGLIGVTGTSGFAAGSGKGHRLGSSSGDAVSAPFGAVRSGGPKSPFMGLGGNAMRVAYVCDASGSMVQKQLYLINEIRKAIDILKPIQQFNVILFPGETARDLCKGLVPAVPANKQLVNTALAEVTFGSSSGGAGTSPIAALQIAFSQKPQLIYLLTDGDFTDNAAVIKFINERNHDRSVKINTILFVSNQKELESAKTFQDVMKQIAEENGGRFKIKFEEEEN